MYLLVPVESRGAHHGPVAPPASRIDALPAHVHAGARGQRAPEDACVRGDVGAPRRAQVDRVVVQHQIAAGHNLNGQKRISVPAGILKAYAI